MIKVRILWLNRQDGRGITITPVFPVSFKPGEKLDESFRVLCPEIGEHMKTTFLGISPSGLAEDPCILEEWRPSVGDRLLCVVMDDHNEQIDDFQYILARLDDNIALRDDIRRYLQITSSTDRSDVEEIITSPGIWPIVIRTIEQPDSWYGERFMGIADIRRLEREAGTILEIIVHTSMAARKLHIPFTDSGGNTVFKDLILFDDNISYNQAFECRTIETAVTDNDGRLLLLEEDTKQSDLFKLHTFEEEEDGTFRHTGNRIHRMNLPHTRPYDAIHGSKARLKALIYPYVKSWLIELQKSLKDQIIDVSVNGIRNTYAMLWNGTNRLIRIFKYHESGGESGKPVATIVSPYPPEAFEYVETPNVFLLSMENAASVYIIEPTFGRICNLNDTIHLSFDEMDFSSGGPVNDLACKTINGMGTIVLIAQELTLTLMLVQDG